MGGYAPPVPRNDRVEFDVRTDPWAQFGVTARAQCHVRTHLVHAWIVTAARAARLGQAHLLPSADSVRGFPDTSVTSVKLGPPDEVRDCRAALDAAGSSMRAVVEWNIGAYLDADGCWLDMVEAGAPGWDVRYAQQRRAS
jgi:hypothetical protein